MSKAARLDRLLPGTKKKGTHAAEATETVAGKTAGKIKALTVKVNPLLYRRLRLYAVDSDMSHQDILVAALERYLR